MKNQRFLGLLVVLSLALAGRWAPLKVFAQSGQASLPMVKVVATDPTALVGVSTASFSLVRDTVGATDLLVACELGGTSSNGVDYLELPNVFTIPAGRLAVYITVQPLANPLAAGNKTVELTLLTNADYVLDALNQDTVTIIDNSNSDLPPSVELTSPAANAVFGRLDHITLAADATASAGATITLVSFFANDQSLGNVTDPPYLLIWSNAPPGPYSVFAKATDQAGMSGLSQPVPITITNAPPVGQIVTPTNGTVVVAPANITLTAEASDPDDPIDHVSFYVNNHRLARIDQAPYTAVWTNPPPGKYTLRAHVADPYLETWSEPVKIEVLKAPVVSNAPPVVMLVSPTNQAVFGHPLTLEVSATVTDSEDAVNLVTFLDNYRVIGSLTHPPYTLLWTNVPPGTHALMAEATDARGAKGRSPKVTIQVTNAPPTGQIVAPTNGTIVVAPANITLTAEASDPDDPIDHVSFYVNNHRLARINQAPYTAVWTNPPPGKYNLKAHVADPYLETWSEPVKIEVLAAPGSGEGLSGQMGSLADSSTAPNFFAVVPTAKGCTVTVTGEPGIQVMVEVSEDLATWSALGALELTGGSGSLRDPAATGKVQRFYRVRRAP